MKTVQKYEAHNGKLFDDATKCAEYEAHVEAVKKLVEWMEPVKTPGCDFANGGGYFELAPGVVERFDAETAKIIERYDSPKQADMYRSNPTGIVGRYLSDSHSPSYELWATRACIGGIRYFGQPYFVSHPHEVKQIVYGRVELPKEPS